MGSCPCLHGEPELMVLKWRPDGDRGLIAVEGAPASHPLLLSSYFISCISLSAASTSHHQATTPSSVKNCFIIQLYITLCVISAITSFPFSLCPPPPPWFPSLLPSPLLLKHTTATNAHTCLQVMHGSSVCTLCDGLGYPLLN